MATQSVQKELERLVDTGRLSADQFLVSQKNVALYDAQLKVLTNQLAEARQKQESLRAFPDQFAKAGLEVAKLEQKMAALNSQLKQTPALALRAGQSQIEASQGVLSRQNLAEQRQFSRQVACNPMPSA